jgi:hypothetical protein
MHARSISIAVVTVVALAAACSSTIPARVTRPPPLPIDANAAFFVTATQQRDRVAQSLVNSGFTATDAWADATYSLNAKFGGSRSTDPCGSVNNVVYEIYFQGQRVMVIKGRGATGACHPNILDEMAQAIRKHAGG